MSVKEARYALNRCRTMNEPRSIRHTYELTSLLKTWLFSIGARDALGDPGARERREQGRS